MNFFDDRPERCRDQRVIALWLPFNCEDAIVRAAMALPWTVIWSEINAGHVQGLLNEGHGHVDRIINNKDDVPPQWAAASDVILIYDVSVPLEGDASAVLRKRRRAAVLENKVEGRSGLLNLR